MASRPFHAPGCKNFIATAGLIISCAATSALATPSVNGNVVSWPDDGWYELQSADTYQTLCEGGRGCTVEPGIYNVINHSTKERFENIIVLYHDDNSPPASSTDTPAPVANTGQTASYREGDDATFNTGITVSGERFTGSEDGTFRDNLTGLTWMSNRNCIVRKTWSDAIDYARQLSANGSECPSLNDGSIAGDWRLPTIKELQSLTDFQNNNPAWADAVPFTGNTWPDFPWDRYWSSTSFTVAPDSNAWSLNAGFGQTEIQGKDSLHYAWPIRVNP